MGETAPRFSPSAAFFTAIHVLGVCSSDESSNPFYYKRNYFKLGLRGKNHA